MYAADTTVYATIKSEEDRRKFQLDVDAIHLWCTNNFMDLNVSKCCWMSVCRYRKLPPLSLESAYVIGNSVIKSSYKLLEVIMTKT